MGMVQVGDCGCNQKLDLTCVVPVVLEVVCGQYLSRCECDWHVLSLQKVEDALDGDLVVDVWDGVDAGAEEGVS